MTTPGFNDVTPSREGKQLIPSDKEPNISAWISKHNLDTEIVTALTKEDMMDIDTLQKFHLSQIGTLGLNSEQESLLSTALQSLNLGDADAVTGLEIWGRQFGITKETVCKLQTGAIDSLEKLKQTTDLQNVLIKLQIKAGQRVKLTLGINAPDQPKRSSSRKKPDDAGEQRSQGTGLNNINNYLKHWPEGNTPEVIAEINGRKIVKVPVVEKYKDCKGNIRKCEIGNGNPSKLEKTIMIVGATVSGKSTLVDGMCNYIFGTEWEDNERLKLIDEHSSEDKNAKAGQAASQTEWITIYTINSGESNKLPYTLNLIDTPGFGDTRGYLRDDRLVEQISSLFENRGEHGIDEIDAVCFVAKSPDARLTSSQRYIFNSVTSIFGKIIEDNILVMITFADGAEPPVLDAIKSANLQYRKSFIFNNSALWEGKKNRCGAYFWEMGWDSFETFFTFLDDLEKQSLFLSYEVLKQRQDLKETLKYLEEKMKFGLTTLNNLEQERQILQDTEDRKIQNSNYLYTKIKHIEQQIKCEKGQFTIRCMNCDETCHSKCRLNTGEKKSISAVMNTLSGNCMRCRGRCLWKDHTNVDYYIDHRIEVVHERSDNMYHNYQQAAGAANLKQKEIKRISDEYDKCQLEVKENVRRCCEILILLRGIAMNPDPWSDISYIEELIVTETLEKKPGWEVRVNQLKTMKSAADIWQDVKDKKNLL